MLRQILAGCLCALLIAVSGCGGSGGSPSSGTGVQVRLNTNDTSIVPTGTFQFVATVTGGTTNTVGWSVEGGPSNGAITGTGLYSAPASTGTYAVIVVSSEDPSANSRATVRVQNGVVVTITPVAPIVKSGDDVQLTGTIVGTTDTRIRWSTAGTGANGIIDSTGLYTAPIKPGFYQVTAKSILDPTRQAKINIQVIPGVTLRLTGYLPTLTIPGGTIKIASKVTGSTNTTVNWTVSPSGSGTLDPDGTWIAPNTPGSYTLTATSAADPTEVKSQVVEVANTVRARVTVEGKGAFVLNLNRTEAPRHVKNFVDLSNTGFYDGIIFHRYEAGFVIQGGDPLTKTLPLTDPSVGSGGPGYTIDLEPNALIHDQFALGMARSESLNSAGSQWYVTLLPAPSLDGLYTVFGNVASGSNVVTSLRRGDKMTSVLIIP